VTFYDLADQEQQIARAQRAAVITTLQEAARERFSIWVFCPWCGHSHLADAQWLTNQVKDPPNMLDELEKRLRCGSCRRWGAKLIPTDRTMVSFDRFPGDR